MSFQGNSIFWVEVDKIVPNPYQPRREFNEESLRELSDSIRMYGVLQPLTVSRKEVIREDGTFYTEYELVAGERRLRASKMGGIEQVPVIIREGEDSEQEKLELAIIENLQREDLNAVDRALAFKQLADMFELTHTQVAQKVGRSREYVANSIRILSLPETILDAVRKGDINEGHGRTLLMLSDKPEEQDTVFREIMLKKLSVREVERIARKIATDKVRKKNIDPSLIEIEKEFTETLGTRVQIQQTEYGGKLTIDYFTQEDLEGMLERLRVLENAVTAPGNNAAQEEDDELAALAAHTVLQFSKEPNTAEDAPASPADEQRDQEATTTAVERAPVAADEVSGDFGNASAHDSAAQAEPAPHSSENEPSAPAAVPLPTNDAPQNYPADTPPAQEIPPAPQHSPTPASYAQPEPPSSAAPDMATPAQPPAPGSHSMQGQRTPQPSPAPDQSTPAETNSPAQPATTEGEKREEINTESEQATAPTVKETEESNLYSIRNFSI